jgi:glycosyltransferase involved in cell wall biosynthesis
MLLSNLNAEIVYCCNTLYDAPVSNKFSYRYVFSYNNIRNNIVKGLSYLMSLIKVIRIAKKERPDVIHIQWWKQWFADYVALICFKRYAKQIVFTAHNVVPHNTGEALKKKCTKYYNRVDKIIVHVQRTKEELVDDFGIDADKIYVIPHGLLSTMEDKVSIQKQYDVLKNTYGIDTKFVISFVGWQDPYKGVDLLKQAYLDSRFLQETPNVLFVIAGRGKVFTKEMMNQFKNLLVFDEFVPSDKLEAIMDITDVLLLPYRRISQSGVLLTAIGKEIPYVATDVGGLSEPINIAPVGWLLKDSSADGLRLMLEYIVSHPEEAVRKKKNKDNWSLVKSYYDWAVIGSKTMECYCR